MQINKNYSSYSSFTVLQLKNCKNVKLEKHFVFYIAWHLFKEFNSKHLTKLSFFL